VLIGAAAEAQPCPADLRPADASYGYRHRAGPDRCGGMYASLVSGDELEMLSFTFGRPAEAATRGGALFIIAPDLHGLGVTAPQSVVVVGRALPLRVYYRLDATLPSNGSISWPVDQVVRPAGLDPNDIGIVGVVKADEGEIYVPLTISTDKAHVSGGVPQVVFRAAVDLDNFQWRLYGVGQSVQWRSNGAAQAGDALILSLDNLAKGTLMTLEVAAKPAAGPYIQSRLKIFRP
jgi:hypothetical protein